MLQLDVWNVLFTVINLLILFVLMRIFLYKPVQKIIAARQAEADKQFDEAAAKQSEAEELKTKYEAVLSDAENEKKKVVAEARKTADEEYQRIVTDAHKTASQIKDDAEAEAISQKEQILKKAEKEIARINKLRSNHYEYYTERGWETPSNYDICVNSDSIGINNVVDLICSIVEKSKELAIK